MHSDFKPITIRAAMWSFIEAVGLRGVQFAIGIILARLLLPDQFGLIGMLTIFLAVAQTFLDSGFGAALIQRQNITEKDTSSIFYFNLLVGVFAAGSLCIIAPGVADFYNQPVLTPLLRLMSLLLVINAFGLVQNILLVKAIDFKTQTKVSLIAMLYPASLALRWHIGATVSGAWLHNSFPAPHSGLYCFGCLTVGGQFAV
jgi:O-antigen/teichoic acid export membrane protein